MLCVWQDRKIKNQREGIVQIETACIYKTDKNYMTTFQGNTDDFLMDDEFNDFVLNNKDKKNSKKHLKGWIQEKTNSQTRIQ